MSRSPSRRPDRAIRQITGGNRERKEAVVGAEIALHGAQDRQWQEWNANRMPRVVDVDWGGSYATVVTQVHRVNNEDER
jgi:hypothetical protein